MALQKTVQMSSMARPGSHCTDGIYGPNTNYCRTVGSINSNWIRIDLGSLKIITFLIIHNRVQLDDPVHYLLLERLSHTDIYVFDNEDPNDNRRLCSRIGDTAAWHYLARCTKPLLARNVELLQLGIGVNRPMNLAEIMVY